MRKLVILLLVLGLTFSLMSKTFADVPPAFNPPRHAPDSVLVRAAKKELERVKKLVDERIKDAINLEIAEKAQFIVKEMGKKGKFSDDAGRLSILISEKEIPSYIPIIETIVKINYLGVEVFRSVDTFANLEIEVYVPCTWRDKLSVLYQKAQEIRRAKEIQDLKSRFGIK